MGGGIFLVEHSHSLTTWIIPQGRESENYCYEDIGSDA